MSRVRCHPVPQRIEEVAARRLVEKSADSNGFELERTEQGLRLELDGVVHELDRKRAASLRDDLSSALTERREFFRTAGEHREDGRYVVSRRGADSAGHSKVFESFGALERLYERLPREFTAETVGRSGLTGGRRHMLVRHLAEHPAFECELVSRQPLTARKAEPPAEDGEAEAAAGADTGEVASAD